MGIKRRFRQTSDFLDTVEQRWEQHTADNMDVNDDVRLYRDTNVISGIILSDNGEEFGGKAKRVIRDKLTNEIMVNSYHIRFIDTSEFSDDNPHRSKPNPLLAKTKEEFLQLRSLLGTRVLQEDKSVFGLSGNHLKIGTVAKCELREDTWWVVDAVERKHPSWLELVKRLEGQNKNSAKNCMEEKGRNGCCCPGSSRNPVSSASGATTGATTSRGGVPETIANPASNCDVPLEGRALLDMIAYNESRGAYNIRYGGDQAIEVTDFSDHPRKAERITRGYNTGKRSSAAGRYQFITKTWDDIAKQEGITDFSPASQDKAAWALAIRDYKANTGRDLMTDLKSGTPGDLNRIGRSLSKTWTSLPGSTSGEELTSDSQFVEGYNNLLNNQKSASSCPE